MSDLNEERLRKALNPCGPPAMVYGVFRKKTCILIYELERSSRQGEKKRIYLQC